MIIFPVIAVGQNMRSIYVRQTCYITAALTVATVVSTFSREGFLALITATGVFLLLQRRRLLMIGVFATVVVIGLAVMPIPDGYRDRIQTIRTYRDVGDESALSRLHFWQVGLQMALDRPFGVGLRNFEAAYDRYDFLDGVFGNGRSVHNSHIQILAEMGFPGLFVWVSLLGYSCWIGLKVRWRANVGAGATPEQHFDFTMSNALLASMSAFVIGGSFIALALNDLTWMTFAVFASMERLSRVNLAVRAPVPPLLGSNLATNRAATPWTTPANRSGPRTLTR
jgi:O-antigen ligase